MDGPQIKDIIPSGNRLTPVTTSGVACNHDTSPAFGARSFAILRAFNKAELLVKVRSGYRQTEPTVLSVGPIVFRNQKAFNPRNVDGIRIHANRLPDPVGDLYAHRGTLRQSTFAAASEGRAPMS